MGELSRTSLAGRSLRYFWRTNLAVVSAVAIATGVLTGALLVGDSVRGSLRDLFVSRLGRTDHVVLANTFFRDELASELERGSSFSAVPLVAFEGVASSERTARRRAGVAVYGVDDRFFRFHGAEPPGLSGREAFVTAALREELDAVEGDALLLRVERPSDVSRGSLHGAKEDVGRTMRLSVRGGLEATGLPEFSIYPRQDRVPAVFVPLARLQRDLDQSGRVNAVLLHATETVPAEAVSEALRAGASLEDLSVRVRLLEPRGALAVESDALMLSEPVARAVRSAAAELDLESRSVFTYLANSMRVGGREVPYSLVAAIDEATLGAELLSGRAPSPDGIVLNDWTGENLDAEPGDALTMEFYVWEEEGRIVTREASFTVDAVVPMTGLAADRDLAPSYPGISETESLSDWEPPFPIDLKRVRDVDEEYWDRFRTTPKAFLPLPRGQELWPVRQGKLTSMRLAPRDGSDPRALRDVLERGIRARLDPLELGFSVVAAREEGLKASDGATDFGEYFVYFSYFLVMAALLLTGLFFKLGVEQRHREVGTLLALGFTPQDVRAVFLLEGLFLAASGAVLGVGLALGYAGVILHGLRTWWVDAVGTRLLVLHVGPGSLLAGVLGGLAAALVATSLTLRYLGRVPARGLLAGGLAADEGATPRVARRAVGLSLAALAASLLLLALSFAEIVSDVVGFFVAGNLVLVAALAAAWAWLRAGGNRAVAGTGSAAVVRLGFRNATWRPGRSLVAVALIAFATFTIVAVDAFRKDDVSGGEEVPGSGSGGYELVAESPLPLHWDPNTEEGRNTFNLPYPSDPGAVEMDIRTFRVRPGDDASCLNLYRPQNPRVLAVPGDFLDRGGFRFAATLAQTPEERENPWLLLRREFGDGAVPVIGDQNSMAYVLHLGLGEDFLLPRVGESSLRLRLVATLRDSIFQSELLMSEEKFLPEFPEVSGFRFFLVDVASGEAEAATSLLEERLADFGLDAESTSARLASFHRVENTYLSTFQSLGGLGLVLGTFGLGAVLLRNAFERRRELALLRAFGYRSRDVGLLIVAENALLLVLGLATGALAAAIAIAPALYERGAGLGSSAPVTLLGIVLAFGMLSSLAAVAFALRAPLLASLRAE